jgi:hypothetical protein
MVFRRWLGTKPPRHTSPGTRSTLADLELRHRRHARVEGRLRTGKDAGLRNLPYHDMAQNRIWVAIAALAADLLASTARLALPGNINNTPRGPRHDHDEKSRLDAWMLGLVWRYRRLTSESGS